MNRRRLYAPTVLGLLAFGGLSYVGASRPWLTTRVTSEGLPVDVVSVSGVDAAPAVSALALVLIASSLAVLAASHRIRRVLGVVIVAVAMTGFAIVLTGQSALDDALAEAIRSSPAFTGAVPEARAASAWRIITAIAFLLAAVWGAVVVRWGGMWPTMSSRYEAPSTPRREPDPDSGADIWKALDDGNDPTQ